MQIFLIMILSALIGGYYYFDSPSFKVEHEYSKTSVAVESEATCIAMQQQKSIDDNLKHLYESGYSFPQYYPCSATYDMETKKYCLTPQGEITQDCFKMIPRGTEKTDCSNPKQSSKCNFENSQYIITKTKKMEGITHSKMMNLIYKLSGGMPNIGLVFENDAKEHVILNANKSESPMKIPPRIVGDMHLEPTELIYINYYDPATIKSIVNTKKRNELKCTEDEIIIYSGDQFICSKFNPLKKCSGDTVLNVNGECIVDESKRANKQCSANQEIYFNQNTNSWDCKLRQIIGCNVGETVNFDGENFTCTPNFNIKEIEGCNTIGSVYTPGTGTTRIKYDPGISNVCNACEAQVYNRETCQINCMPGKQYISQKSCLSPAKYVKNWWNDRELKNVPAVPYDSKLGSVSSDTCRTNSEGAITNHNCGTFINVYWNPTNRSWQIFDCFPLTRKTTEKGIHSPYDTNFSKYSADVPDIEKYKIYWDDVLADILKKNLESQMKFFCDTSESGSHKKICKRMNMNGLYVQYSLSQNRCYDPTITDPDNPGYIDPVDLPDEEKKEREKLFCPDGFTRSSSDTTCVSNPKIECGDKYLVRSTGNTMYCWEAPVLFKEDSVSGDYKLKITGFYQTISDTKKEEVPLTIYQTEGEGIKSCASGVNKSDTKLCAGLANTPLKDTSNLILCDKDTEGKCKDATNYNGCPAGTKRNSKNVCETQWNATPCPYETYLNNQKGTPDETFAKRCKNGNQCKAGYAMKFIGTYNEKIKEIQATAFCIPTSATSSNEKIMSSGSTNTPAVQYIKKDYKGHVYYDKQNTPVAIAKGVNNYNTIDTAMAEIIITKPNEDFTNLDNNNIRTYLMNLEISSCDSGNIRVFDVDTGWKNCSINFCDGIDYTTEENQKKYGSYILTYYKIDVSKQPCRDKDGMCSNSIFGSNFPSSLLPNQNPDSNQCLYAWRPNVNGLPNTSNTYDALKTQYAVSKILNPNMNAFIPTITTKGLTYNLQGYRLKSYEKTSNYSTGGVKQVSSKLCPSPNDGRVRLWSDEKGWADTCVLNWEDNFQKPTTRQVDGKDKTGWIIASYNTKDATSDTEITGVLDVPSVYLHRPELEKFWKINEDANHQFKGDDGNNINIYHTPEKLKDFAELKTGYQGIEYVWSDINGWPLSGQSTGSIAFCTTNIVSVKCNGKSATECLPVIYPYTMKLKEDKTCYNIVQPIYYATMPPASQLEFDCKSANCPTYENRFGYYETPSVGFYSKWNDASGWESKKPMDCTFAQITSTNSSPNFWGLKKLTIEPSLKKITALPKCFTKFTPPYALAEFYKNIEPYDVNGSVPECNETNYVCEDSTATTGSQCINYDIPVSLENNEWKKSYLSGTEQTASQMLQWATTGGKNVKTFLNIYGNYILTKEEGTKPLKIHLCRPTYDASLTNFKLSAYNLECANYASMKEYNTSLCTAKDYDKCLTSYQYRSWNNSWSESCENNICVNAGTKPTGFYEINTIDSTTNNSKKDLITECVKYVKPTPYHQKNNTSCLGKNDCDWDALATGTTSNSYTKKSATLAQCDKEYLYTDWDNQWKFDGTNCKKNMCTNSPHQDGYFEAEIASINSDQPLLSKCIGYTKPAPHIILNNAPISTCVNQPDSNKCAYVSGYQWEDSTGLGTYKSCSYGSDTQALCTKKGESIPRNITWENGTWKAGGEALCIGATSTPKYIKYVNGSCVDYCRPTYESRNLSSTLVGTFSDCCGSESDPSCNFKILDNYQFSIWTASGWSSTAVNTCASKDSILLAHQISYLADITDMVNIETPSQTFAGLTKCESTCRPNYNFKGETTLLKSNCCNPTNPADNSASECTTHQNENVQYQYHEWNNSSGWGANPKYNYCTSNGQINLSWILSSYIYYSKPNTFNQINTTDCVQYCKPKWSYPSLSGAQKETDCATNQAYIYNHCDTNASYKYSTWSDLIGWGDCSSTYFCANNTQNYQSGDFDTRGYIIKESIADTNTGLSKKDGLTKCALTCQPAYINDENKNFTNTSNCAEAKVGGNYPQSPKLYNTTCGKSYEYSKWSPTDKHWSKCDQKSICSSEGEKPAGYMEKDVSGISIPGTTKCLKYVKPAPHIQLNGMECIGNSTCEYTGTPYSWTAQAGTTPTYKKCEFKGTNKTKPTTDDQNHIINCTKDDNTEVEVYWTGSSWSVGGMADCSTAQATLTAHPNYISFENICRDYCRPNYSKSACCTSNPRGETSYTNVHNCNYNEISSGPANAYKYQYNKWEDENWSASKINYCEYDDNQKKYIKYLRADNRNDINTNKPITSQCLTNCQPSYTNRGIEGSASIEQSEKCNSHTSNPHQEKTCGGATQYLYSSWSDTNGWGTCNNINTCKDNEMKNGFIVINSQIDTRTDGKASSCAITCQPIYDGEQTNLTSKTSCLSTVSEYQTVKSHVGCTATSYSSWNTTDTVHHWNQCQTLYCSIQDGINKAESGYYKKHQAQDNPPIINVPNLQCVKVFKPAPHLYFTNTDTEHCVKNPTAPACQNYEYKDGYLWNGSTSESGLTIIHCEYRTATQAYCKTASDLYLYEWENAKWINKGKQSNICTTNNNKPNYIEFIRQPDVCTDYCRPAFGSATTCCATNPTGETSYTPYECNYHQDATYDYKYFEWLTTGWTTTPKTNYCSAYTSGQNHYIEYKISEGQKSLNCLSNCQPKYNLTSTGIRENNTDCTATKIQYEKCSSSNYEYADWNDATGWSSICARNYCTTTSQPTGYFEKNTSNSPTNGFPTTDCITYVKPSPHIVLNNMAQHCRNSSDPKCEYTSSYGTWSGAGINYKICTRINDDNAVCTNNAGKKIGFKWQSGTWVEQAMQTCSGAQNLAGYLSYEDSSGDLPCTNYCKPQYGSPLSCYSSDAEYKCDNTDQYKYAEWNNGAWQACTSENYCPTTTDKPGHIHFARTTPTENTIKTLKCLDNCRPAPTATNLTGIQQNNLNCCIEEECSENKIAYGSLVYEWSAGWSNRNAICETDKTLNASWTVPTPTNGPSWLHQQMSGANCGGGFTSETTPCQYCKATICTDGKIYDDLSDTEYAQCTGDFTVPYNTNTCWSCGTVPLPTCPDGEGTLDGTPAIIQGQEVYGYQFKCKKDNIITMYFTPKKNSPQSEEDCLQHYNYKVSSLPVGYNLQIIQAEYEICK